MNKKLFHGWFITAGAFLTFGISVGIPYYNISFFYDYFQRAFGWSRSEITFGFPLAALITIWAGPLLVPKFSPRKLILFGTGLTALALAGFAWMGGSLPVYYGLWVLYTVGYICAGPIPHQIIVSQWFRRKRGTAMGIVYVGVGLLAGMMFLAWPLALWLLPDKPAEMGLYPDGDSQPAAEAKIAPESFATLLRSYPFWLLLIGSFCSIGSIGAVNFHMKFVFLDEGFHPGEQLDGAWRTA